MATQTTRTRAMERAARATMSQTKRSRSTPAADALTFNVSGLLAEPPGTVRELEISAPPLDLGPDLRQSRGLAGPSQADPDQPRAAGRGPLLHRSAAGLQPLPARDRLPGRRSRWTKRRCRASTGERPACRYVRRAGRAAPQRPSRAGPGGEIRDAIVLAEPIAPLCRRDCPGLCRSAAGELAGGDHDHPETEIDPRLEVLRQLSARRAGLSLRTATVHRGRPV